MIKYTDRQIDQIRLVQIRFNRIRLDQIGRQVNRQIDRQIDQIRLDQIDQIRLDRLDRLNRLDRLDKIR